MPENPRPENDRSSRVEDMRRHIQKLQSDISNLQAELSASKSNLKECDESKKQLMKVVIELTQQAEKLFGYLEDLVALGEPPYAPAVFISLSEVNDGRKEEIKKFLGAPIDYYKCYLMFEGGVVMVGSVSKRMGDALESGQLVLVNGNQAIVEVVPDNEIKHLKAVREGVVERIADDIIIVGDKNGFRGGGVVYSPRVKAELDRNPLNEGDKVLLFGPCILAVIERIEKKHAAVNIRPATFADIGGLDDKIQEIRDILGLDFSDEAKRAIGLEEARGLTLYGPPGVGKTLLVRAIANELGYYFVLVNGADFESMWVGMSQKELRSRLDDARKNKPSIVFFDEVEAAFPVRGSSLGLEHKNDNLAAFNTFMDGIENTSGVFVIFGSNRIDKVDPAVIRSGRMDKKIYIPRPNREGAKKILKIYLRRHPVSEPGDKEAAIEKWAERLVEEIYLVHRSTHLFTAFHGNDSRKYYFKDFISGAIFRGIVNEGVLRALKRLKAAGTSPDSPAFGLVAQDFDGVSARMVIQEVPQDDRSRNEWLMVNGYPRAEEFRDGDAILKFQENQKRS